MECGRTYAGSEAIARCACGGLLDVELDLGVLDPSVFDQRLLAMRGVDHSGVWRYRELLPPIPATDIVSKPEGNTNLYDMPALAEWAGVARLALKHEGENPTGSLYVMCLLLG
jgi:threonine synthase